MRTSRPISIATVALGMSLCGSLFAQTATPTVQRTENFNTSDGGFIGFNNRNDPTPPTDPGKQNYGWTTGDNLPDTPDGRIGGDIGRGVFEASYYAANTGSLNPNTELTFSATFTANTFATEYFFGYFLDPVIAQGPSGNRVPAHNFVGFNIEDRNDQTQVNLQAYTNKGGGTNDGTDPTRVIGEPSPGIFVAPGVPNGSTVTLNFRYTPGPDGPDEGTNPDSAVLGGRVITDPNNIGPETTVEITNSAVLDEFVNFNRFGIRSRSNDDNPQGPASFTFDDLVFRVAAPSGGVAGDFNNDAVVNATDIDLLCDRINAGTGPIAPFDVNNDNSVNNADVNFEVTNILDTKFGDTDTDGDVDLNDLGNLASGFNVAGEKRWSRGNFDCDLDVDLNDLGTLATNFGAGRAAAMAAFEALVPEPSALSLVAIGGLALSARRRRA
jgi:hypothetical protein